MSITSHYMISDHNHVFRIDITTQSCCCFCCCYFLLTILHVNLEPIILFSPVSKSSKPSLIWFMVSDRKLCVLDETMPDRRRSAVATQRKGTTDLCAEISLIFVQRKKISSCQSKRVGIHKLRLDWFRNLSFEWHRDYIKAAISEHGYNETFF